MDKGLYDQIVKERPYLWWWVKDTWNLSLESVVQGVLANGDMDDIERLFQLVGREQVKKIFLKQISRPRHNYRRQTVNFFRKVFAAHV
jgi:hypothetical protein